MPRRRVFDVRCAQDSELPLARLPQALPHWYDWVQLQGPLQAELSPQRAAELEQYPGIPLDLEFGSGIALLTGSWGIVLCRTLRQSMPAVPDRRLDLGSCLMRLCVLVSTTRVEMLRN